MSEVNGIKRVMDKGIFYCLFFISTTFPLPYKISNIGIFALVLFWLLQKVVTKKLPSYQWKDKNEKLIFFSFIALFFWVVIALVYTVDIPNGISNIESKLSFLIFPLILYDIRLKWDKMLFLMKSYIYSMGICTVYLLSLSYAHYLEEGTLLTYHDFTRALGFHAVFYSYYSFLAIVLSVAIMAKVSISKNEKWLIGSVVFLSFVGLVISASKNVLVVTTLSIVIGVFIRLLKRKIRLKEIVVILIIVAVGAIGISQLSAVKNRVAELTQLNGMENLDKIRQGEKLEEVDIRKFNGTSLRITFWYVSINKLIEDRRLMHGLSPGDRRKVMNDKYYENGINPWYENYNIHNQFIQILVELGIIGLFIYLILHQRIILDAMRYKNYVLLIFVLGLIIFQMTESIIERNKGIVFLTYFLILLQQFNLFSNENRDIRN